mgnify:CR=1 FL=1|tara:strand:+ start:329589 stop:329960 length:372 start_codon:yes stop_codon:yes gene_type:complete
MNHQTKTVILGSTLQTSVTLIAGIALCTWLGGNVNQAHHVLKPSTLSSASTMHLIKMPNAGSKNLMAAPNIEDKFSIEMGQKGETETETKSVKKQVELRTAIYRMPDLKSTNNKQVHLKDITT